MSNDLSERLDRVEEALDIIVRDAQMVLPESISPAAVRRIRALLSPVLPFSDAAVAGDIPAHREATNSTDPATARWQCADCGSWNLKERFDCHECGGFVPPRPAGRSFKGTAPFGAGPHDDSSASIGAAVAKESAGGATPPIGTEPPTTPPLSEEREREIRRATVNDWPDLSGAWWDAKIDLLAALDHWRWRAERFEALYGGAQKALDHERARAEAAEERVARLRDDAYELVRGASRDGNALADALRYKAAVERLEGLLDRHESVCLYGDDEGDDWFTVTPSNTVRGPATIGRAAKFLEAIEAVPLPGGAKT